MRAVIPINVERITRFRRGDTVALDPATTRIDVARLEATDQPEADIVRLFVGGDTIYELIFATAIDADFYVKAIK